MKTSHNTIPWAWLVKHFSSDASWIEFHKQIIVEFTDSYGETNVGLTRTISVSGKELAKPIQLVTIDFQFFTKVTVEKKLRQTTICSGN